MHQVYAIDQASKDSAGLALSFATDAEKLAIIVVSYYFLDTKQKYCMYRNAFIVIENQVRLFQISGCDIAGDGYCDDATNDGRCDFDGGDCCLPSKDTQFCLFCLCYAEKPEGKYVN